MNRRIAYQFIVGLVMLAVAVGIGAYGYNLGVAHGLERAAATTGTPPPWGYWRPWGFGFFPFFPFAFFILFWLFVSRALFWRGRRYGRWHGGCGETYPDRRGRTTHL